MWLKRRVLKFRTGFNRFGVLKEPIFFRFGLACLDEREFSGDISLKVGWMGLATWRKQHQIWVEFSWVSLWNLNWHLCFLWLRQVTGMQQVDVFRNICCFIFLFLCSFRPSSQDVSNFDGFNVTLNIDPKGKGRCSRALPHVQCGSGRKLTVFVQTMMCSHVFLTTTPWLELGRSLNITIHSRDTWAEPTQMVVVWVIKRLVLRIVSQYGSPSLPTNGMGSRF